MDPIEQSVRRALEGGDPANHAFRRSIYAASYRAMERMAATRRLVDDELQAERARVAEVIDRVESEYASFYGSDDGSAPAASDREELRSIGADPVTDAAADQAGATTPRQPSSYATTATSEERGASEGEVWRPGGQERAPSRRGGRALLLVIGLVLVLAAVLTAAAFWSRSGAPDQAATPPAPGATGEPPQETAQLDPLAWIDVFSGANIDQVGAASGARVSSVEAEGRSAIRIAGPQGGEGEVTINLGAGVVQRIAGSEVRVEIVAGSPDGGPREFSVRCVFGEASVCDRQRFATAMPEEAFIFDVAIPGGASAPANLAIGPALTAAGPDVDIFSVRMRVL